MFRKSEAWNFEIKLKETSLMFAKINKGTHTIQKMVDLANLDEEEKFFETVLTGQVGMLAIDQQGTHIIQKIITSFTEINRQYVFNEIQDAFLYVSKNSHGLCVIKKLVANTSNTNNRESLVEFISQNAIELIQDPYGNYAVQEVMEKWREQNFTTLYNKVKSKIAQLSIQKFSSNVVEKWLELSVDEQRSDFICSIAKIDKLVNVMKNSFGNYVVQKALFLANIEAKEVLADSIYENIPIIQDKKIKMKWAQLLYSSIQNDYTLVSKYELEKYLVETPIQRKSDSPNHIDQMHLNREYDNENDEDFRGDKSSHSPPPIYISRDNSLILQPKIISQHSFNHPYIMDANPFYNFEVNYGNDTNSQMYPQYGYEDPFSDNYNRRNE